MWETEHNLHLCSSIRLRNIYGSIASMNFYYCTRYTRPFLLVFFSCFTFLLSFVLPVKLRSFFSSFFLSLIRCRTLNSLTQNICLVHAIASISTANVCAFCFALSARWNINVTHEPYANSFRSMPHTMTGADVFPHKCRMLVCVCWCLCVLLTQHSYNNDQSPNLELSRLLTKYCGEFQFLCFSVNE